MRNSVERTLRFAITDLEQAIKIEKDDLRDLEKKLEICQQQLADSKEQLIEHEKALEISTKIESS